MPTIVNKGRGTRKAGAVTIASAALTTTAVPIIAGAANKIRVVERVYFQIPNDVTKWDASLRVNGAVEAGTAVALWRIDEAGVNGPTDIRAVWDIDLPNPPTGKYYGYCVLENAILDGTSDQVDFIGYDGTAGNNYTSTGATALVITAVYREMSKADYMKNLG